MHELAITQSVLEIALRHAGQRNADPNSPRASRITDLHLVIGQWASAVDDSVQFYWDMISDGTIAQGAKLHFRRIPAELLCLDCNQQYSPGDPDLFCPHCHGPHTKIVHGDEFYVESIDVDV